jgi:hypothetical protein
MDKTPSYAWENPRKVMENEISESSSPVITRTSKFSRKAMVKEMSGSLLITGGARTRIGIHNT